MAITNIAEDVRAKAAETSRDGHIRHVVHSPTWGPSVFTNDQARVFERQVHIEATYFCGVLIEGAEVSA